jgi:hypothetical protein
VFHRFPLEPLWHQAPTLAPNKQLNTKALRKQVARVSDCSYDAFPRSGASTRNLFHLAEERFLRCLVACPAQRNRPKRENFNGAASLPFQLRLEDFEIARLHMNS